jgi:hypothetical protein
MLHSRNTTLSALPLWLTLSCLTPLLAQVSARNSPSSASAQSARSSQNDPAPAPVAEPIPANAPRISAQTRLEVIRDFETQLVYSRTTFPMNTKGLRLKHDVITPNGEELSQALSLWGPAIKPGDPARISMVQIKDDHIHFEINGGPTRHKKWYQRIEVSGTYDTPVAGGPDVVQSNPHGSFVDVYFGKYVPEMTVPQLRALLYPVLDFNARNKEQAYLDAVPPKAKEAIQAHRVLVGMDSEMVIHAKGRPPKKVRERDGETEYEEWIYGEPPADVDFVRMVGDEVVRVETIKVTGEKIVRTEKEIILQRPDKDKDREAKKEPGEGPTVRPTMRRPGEDSEGAPEPAGNAAPLPLPPPRGPDDPKPQGIPVPDGPGDFLPAL